MIPISKDIIAPVITTNILFVNSVEEFEALEFGSNKTMLAFDNFKQVFYTRHRNYIGQYEPVNIYFYENFAQKAQNFEREEFVKRCKDVGLNDLKTEVACMFFLDNKKPLEVWEWSLKNTTKDWEWDYVRSLKCKLKKKLFQKL